VGNGGVGPVHGKSLPLLCPRSNEFFGPANMPASNRLFYLPFLKKFKVTVSKSDETFCGGICLGYLLISICVF